MSPTPHGGILCDLHSRDSSIRSELLTESKNLPSLILSERSLCDLELIMNGGFSPLKGFMNQEDYHSVLHQLRLSNGILWSIPITLDITDAKIKSLSIRLGSRIVLKDPRDHTSLAIMTINSIWKPNQIEESEKVFESTDQLHPSIYYLFNSTHSNYIGGEIQSINLPIHYDYQSIRFTPFQLRQRFQDLSWNKIIAFQTRNPMHKAHVNLTLRASLEHQHGNLLIHPVVGLTKPGDIDYHTRVKVYKAVLETYPKGLATLALLPLAMRMAGPREAVWHAIIRRNYGATHFIVGRDHAGPGKSSKGTDFYSPYEAQSLVKKYQNELEIKMIPFGSMIYLPESDEYKPIQEIKDGIQTKDLSGTELRRLLQNGDEIPTWFSFSSVIKILKEAYPPKHKQGFVIFLTGLDRSIKTNLSKALETSLQETSSRSITLLTNSSPPTLNQTEENSDPERLQTHAFLCAELCKSGSAVISSSNLTSKEINRTYLLESVKKKGGRGANGMGVLVHVLGGLEDADGDGDGINGNIENNKDSWVNGNGTINGIVKTNGNGTINGNGHNGNVKINGKKKLNGFKEIG
ncbi:uncharacterized protein MELLADRAFT_33800 [Melampsora larici-populina 98AG31]|uniref:sulfate adenylyltransferase n=1 Tax=Melampsora larici-populina (strain 98AG31 / pathotype 3-4-7) TaxID=747676 RepID=F4RAL3_MELLP|nr:uncharacterized protein MELLADRAFT_33800 [Melampsora larici-populina 98AG31]EGG10761.1 hypothetical protein MELLADRAFT_33800 [Melampsora larici-populina 98AG31]